jgi:S-adenosylmethionine synthetase
MLTVAKSSWRMPYGVAEPVSVYVDCFGTNRIPEQDIVDYIIAEYDLTPQGIINALGLFGCGLQQGSSYGHFGKAGVPWEE